MNTPTKTPAPIFLYLKSCRMSKLVIQQLIAAGYIPIEVACFDDVKIFEPLPLLQHQTISEANQQREQQIRELHETIRMREGIPTVDCAQAQAAKIEGQ